MNVRCATIIVKAISRLSFHLTFSISFEKPNHIIDQKIIHQKSMQRNVATQVQIVAAVIAPLLIIASITRNNASAVQSLNKLSPSNINTSLLGAQNCLNRDNTATGSVEEIIEPKSIAISRGIGNQIKLKAKYSPYQTIKVEISNHMIANAQIDFQFFNS